MIRLARDEARACASVLATMKSTPDRPAATMLLTALPPAPPTPQTMICGFNSFSSGAFRLIGIFLPLVGRPPLRLNDRTVQLPFSGAGPGHWFRVAAVFTRERPQSNLRKVARAADSCDGRALALMVNVPFLGLR